MAEIRVPALGESVTEATIGKWFKHPGDAVAVDEPLVELETDKVTIEVPAPATAPVPPSVRRIAAESGIDPATLAGSGRDGRVTKADMLAAIERAAAAPTPIAQPSVSLRAPTPPDDAAREERVKMTRLRQTIARRLKEAQSTAAMLTTFNEVDMTAVMQLRNHYKEPFEKKHGA